MSSERLPKSNPPSNETDVRAPEVHNSKSRAFSNSVIGLGLAELGSFGVIYGVRYLEFNTVNLVLISAVSYYWFEGIAMFVTGRPFPLAAPILRRIGLRSV